jgi:hypothetical protein
MILKAQLQCTGLVLTSRTDMAEKVAVRGYFSFAQGVDGATFHVSSPAGSDVGESPVEAL